MMSEYRENFKKFMSLIKECQKLIKINSHWQQYASMLHICTPPEIVDEIPYFKFKKGWEVKITPGNNALIRFRVRREDTIEGEYVCVYFDPWNAFGVMDGPYWEIYPIPYTGEEFDATATNKRFDIGDAEGILEGIEEGLDYLSENRIFTKNC